MTATELSRYTLELSGRQLEACFAGMDADDWESRLTEQAMTPLEIAAHLAEAYQAFITLTEGREHRWGSFKIEPNTPEAVLSEMFRLRQQAIDSVGERDVMIRAAFDYLTAHDAYHVGQLVLARLQVHPDWNFMAIYG